MTPYSMTTQKYDVLSCGLGALACTSLFVYNGQDPGTALSITLMATISGLVRMQPRCSLLTTPLHAPVSCCLCLCVLRSLQPG